MHDLAALQKIVDAHADIIFADGTEEKDYFPNDIGLTKKIKNFFHKARTHHTYFKGGSFQCGSYKHRSIRDVAIYTREPLEEVIKTILELAKDVYIVGDGPKNIEFISGFYCYTTEQFVFKANYPSRRPGYNGIYFGIPGWTLRELASEKWQKESMKWFETFADLTGDNGYIPS